MACKMKCPVCSKILKEEGDNLKEAQGEYRVYDSLWTPKAKAGKYREVKCLSCGSFSPIEKWPLAW